MLMFGHLPAVHRFDEVLGSTMQDSLLSLDVSNNSIERVECLPSRAKIILSHNKCPLNFSRGVLAKAGREVHLVQSKGQISVKLFQV